ncbi:carbohydrate ABC transporter permease [Paenarthrobacter sp. A20]|uniref:carbohydrate ABC transporter permease n=1 Tax=Paenarthrobacter sp. A20 TaxID=2817891 RepID=UPI0020A1AF7A|nr:carbohydrate ABC transporter permease [Paenarthrobacter sp. A20]MCP1415732.1 multiple sugar transport system permease protein [Paenarthrobacter sp. A20]
MSVLANPRTENARPTANSKPVIRKRRSPTGESPVIRWGRRISLTLIGLFALLPIYWLIVTSLRKTETVFEFPPQLLPVNVTFEHFGTIFGNGDLLRFLLNSILVSVITAISSVLIGMYCAYSFSKFRYRGRRSLMFLILCSQLFPHVLLLITIYGLFSALGMLNSYPALVLAFTTFTLPLCIWMLKGTFDNIPDELIEAAKIDGANQFVIIHKILFPLAAPGLIAAGLFAFVRGWNDFVFALTLSGDATRTLPPGLVTTYLNEFSNRWPELMAASLVAALPVLAIFMALQKYFVAGLGAGAVKG